MNSFVDYYNGAFRGDLLAVLIARPSLHDHRAGETTIQPRTISRSNPIVRKWPDERRMVFATGLFLTVLADQVCFTHFQGAYRRFRDLTHYPKWRGDCPGGCASHAHPGLILERIGRREGERGSFADLPYSAAPGDLITGMEREARSFVEEHLAPVNADQFWARCDHEIPLDFRTRYLDSRGRLF